MHVLLLHALAGCTPGGATLPPPAPPAGDPDLPVIPVSPAALHVDGPARALPGLCEPSGAARRGDGPIWIVDDDQPDAVFSWEPGAPPRRHGLPDAPVRDAEGLSFDPEGGLWITGGMGRSAGSGKVGKRGVLARLVDGPAWRTDLQSDALRPGKDAAELEPLRAAIAAACPACALPGDAAGTEDGRALDAEGLTWGPAGQLLVGLRAPLVADKAVVFAVDPVALRASEPVARIVTAAWALDLGGRGIRDLAAGPDGTLLVLAGGASGRETPSGALYAWRPHTPPQPIGPLPRLGGAAEAVVPDGERAAWILLDEGRRLGEGLRAGGPHAAQDDGQTVFQCGAGRASDWAHAVRVTW